MTDLIEWRQGRGKSLEGWVGNIPLLMLTPLAGNGECLIGVANLIEIPDLPGIEQGRGVKSTLATYLIAGTAPSLDEAKSAAAEWAAELMHRLRLRTDADG